MRTGQQPPDLTQNSSAHGKIMSNDWRIEIDPKTLEPHHFYSTNIYTDNIDQMPIDLISPNSPLKG